jgi:DNA polymerase (family 10)
VIEAAAAAGTFIEINGSPRRRDLNERNVRVAADAGIPIVLNTDAHRVSTLGNMAYALATARRAGLTKADVANSRPWRGFNALRKQGRKL